MQMARIASVQTTSVSWCCRSLLWPLGAAVCAARTILLLDAPRQSLQELREGGHLLRLESEEKEEVGWHSLQRLHQLPLVWLRPFFWRADRLAVPHSTRSSTLTLPPSAVALAAVAGGWSAASWFASWEEASTLYRSQMHSCRCKRTTSTNHSSNCSSYSNNSTTIDSTTHPSRLLHLSMTASLLHSCDQLLASVSNRTAHLDLEGGAAPP